MLSLQLRGHPPQPGQEAELDAEADCCPAGAMSGADWWTPAWRLQRMPCWTTGAPLSGPR